MKEQKVGERKAQERRGQDKNGAVYSRDQNNPTLLFLFTLFLSIKTRASYPVTELCGTIPNLKIKPIKMV